MRNTIFRTLASLSLLLLAQCAQDSKTFNQDDLENFTGTVSGQVLSRKGAPIPSVTITVTPGGATTTTDGEGNFTLAKISEGAHQIRFMKADYRDTLQPDSIHLGLGDSATAAAQTMTYRYATVTGSVVDKNGSAQPMAGVAVQAQTASAMAMTEGKFLLSRVEPGTVKLFAALAGTGYGTKEITLGAEDSVDISNISLDHLGGTVSGTIVDAAGAVVSGATVSAVGGALNTLTNTQGQYTLTTVPSDGNVQLTVTYNNQDVGTAFVQVGEGGTATLPDLAIGDGLGVDLLALLPSTQLAPSGATGLTLVAQAVWDTTDETNTPYWYIWSTDSGNTWDSTTAPFYTLEPQAFADLKQNAICDSSSRCRFTVSTLAAALDGNQSKMSTITIVFPAADQDLPVPASSATGSSSSASVGKATSIWDALNGAHGASGLDFTLLGGSWYTYANGLNSAALPVTAQLDSSIQANGYLKTNMHLDVDATQGWASAGLAINLNATGTVMDLSSQKGLCITYRSSHAGEFELYGNIGGIEYHYRATVPTATIWRTLDVPFTSFAPITTASPAMSTAILQSKLHASGLLYTSNATTALDRELNLAQIGWYGECDTAGTGKITQPFSSSLTLAAPPFIPSTKAALWDIANGMYGHDTLIGGKTIIWPYSQAKGIGGTAGAYWFSYNDWSQNGTSIVTPSSYDSVTRIDYFNDTIAKYGYLHTTFQLTTAFTSPFGDIVLPLKKPETVVDLSDSNALCITYKSSAPIDFKLTSVNADWSCGYGECNFYKTTLPAAGAWTARKLLLDTTVFKQAAGWGTAVNFDTVLKSLVSRLDFQYQINTATSSAYTATLDILQVGWNDQCSAIVK